MTLLMSLMSCLSLDVRYGLRIDLWYRLVPTGNDDRHDQSGGTYTQLFTLTGKYCFRHVSCVWSTSVWRWLESREKVWTEFYKKICIYLNVSLPTSKVLKVRSAMMFWGHPWVLKHTTA